VAIVVENFDAVTVLDDAGFFVDGGDVIAQVGLDSGDVGDFENASATALAADEKHRAGETENDDGRARQIFWEELHKET
jgi:hypothetical protein